jgi:hypothetical protein
MRRWLLPALAYFGVVFAIGFALGAVRELALTPRFGRFVGVLIELPLMMLASVLAARWIVRRWGIVQMDVASRVGISAFAMLLVAECLIALIASGVSPLAFLKDATSPTNMPGLAAQMLFALLPLFVVAVRQDAARRARQAHRQS